MKTSRVDCEYALFRWEGSAAGAVRKVLFSHCGPWEDLGRDQFLPTLARLEAEGWEMTGHEHFTDDNLIFRFRRYRA